jgi:hypothetical protein
LSACDAHAYKLADRRGAGYAQRSTVATRCEIVIESCQEAT